MNRNEIAKLAGVSSATISRFFNKPHLLSLAVRTIIEEVVRENAYQPNTFASQLAKKSKGQIALVFIPNESLFEYQRFQAIYYLLLPELNKLPLSLVVFTAISTNFNRNQFDKVIFLGQPDNSAIVHQDDLIIFSDSANKTDKSYISIDPIEVGKTLVELFCPASKQMPLILLPSGYQYSYLFNVIESIKDTLKQYDVFPNPHHFLEGADSFESGQSSTTEGFNLGLGFHSIIAFNQEAALGAISALKIEGMTYPFDAQVVHYGHPKEFYFTEHEITCLSDPLFLIIENILKFINGKKIQIQIPPLFLKGQTY